MVHIHQSGVQIAACDRIVSVHFPKAAGSSLKEQMLRLLPGEVTLDYDGDPIANPSAAKTEFPIGSRVVHGHFRPWRYESTKAYRMTFLRHPVDNLISIFFFWQCFDTASNALHRRFLEEKPSILDFATYPGIRRLMSETYFGGFDMRRFDFIGFYESRARDIGRLARILELPFLSEFHANKTIERTERQRIEHDSTTLRKLTDLLADDITFYERLPRC